jgi:hypothetical protein
VPASPFGIANPENLFAGIPSKTEAWAKFAEHAKNGTTPPQDLLDEINRPLTAEEKQNEAAKQARIAAAEATAIWPTDAELDLMPYTAKQEADESFDKGIREDLAKFFGKHVNPGPESFFKIGALYKRNSVKIPDWAKSGTLQTMDTTEIHLNYAFKEGDVILVVTSPEPERMYQNVLVVHNNARCKLYLVEGIMAYWDFVQDSNLP